MRKSVESNIKEFAFWVSGKYNSLSLHQEKGYEKIICSDYTKMWEQIYDLVDLGFRVQ